jgi:Fe-S-cluster containining protein
MNPWLPQAFGFLDSLAAEPGALEGFLSAVRAFYAEVDNWVQALAAEHGADIACRPGCFHCCPRKGVEAALFELVPIVVELNRRPSRLLVERIRSRARETSAPPAGGADGDSLFSLLQIAESSGRAPASWEPCPFLEEGLCRIYTVRPLACRLHVSVSERSCAEAMKPSLPRGFTSALSRTVAARFETIRRRGLGPLLDSGGLVIRQIDWDPDEGACSLAVGGRRYGFR